MDVESLKKEIAELEDKIQSLEDRRPDHDHTGRFGIEMLQLTEALEDKVNELKAGQGC
ncbi:MAG: hypothetical protein QF662_07560 [Phycisphaerae bacterium]|jgi:hypothetical protein|nr:hypothetical protein [Phycisphaerae bacterium]